MKKRFTSLQLSILSALALIVMSFSAQAVNINVAGTVTRLGTPIRSQYVVLTDSISRKDTSFFNQPNGTFNVNFNTASSATQGYILVKFPDCQGNLRRDTVLRYTSGITAITGLTLERCLTKPISPYKIRVTGKVDFLPNAQMVVEITGQGLYRTTANTDSLGNYSAVLYARQTTGQLTVKHNDCNGKVLSKQFTYLHQKDTLFSAVNFIHCVNPAFVSVSFKEQGFFTGNIDIECSIDNFSSISLKLNTGTTGRANGKIPITAGSSGSVAIRYKNCQNEWVSDSSQYYPTTQYFFHFPIVHCSDTLPTKYTAKIYKAGNLANSAKAEVLYWNSTTNTALKKDTIIATNGEFSFKLRNNEEILLRAFLTANDNDFGGFAPSYYPAVLYWKNATVLKHDKNQKQKSISIDLVETNKASGSNSLNGKVVDLSGASPQLGNSTLIALYNTSMQLVDFVTPDANLEFELKNLDTTSYTLTAYELEKYAEPRPIKFKWDNNSRLDILAKINSDSTYIEIADYTSMSEFKRSEFKLYPNPTHGQVNLYGNLEKLGQILIRDLTGNMVFVKNLTATESKSFNLGELSKGLYLVELLSQEKKMIGRVKLQLVK
jgi:hypothetical protein